MLLRRFQPGFDLADEVAAVVRSRQCRANVGERWRLVALAESNRLDLHGTAIAAVPLEDGVLLRAVR